MSDENIIINCAKTAVKALFSMESLRDKSDFSADEINQSLGKFLDGNTSSKDYNILHSACVFCMDIGGLEEFGLKYNNEEIQQVLLKIEMFGAR